MLSAFLWSGPQLNHQKTKIAWDNVCRPLSEGGLGVRLLSEMNTVGCLKMLWRVVSNQPSLWVSWVHTYLLRGKSFWSIPVSTTRGSWMWKKLLKSRGLARSLHKTEVNNGENSSFWFDCWSSFGCLLDKLGSRGVIDLGVALHSTIATAWDRRRRRHRVETLEKVEDELQAHRLKADPTIPDIHCWKSRENKFRPSFSSKDTFNLTRHCRPNVSWSSGIWFAHNTPKFSMFVWLAIHNRLTTGDKMAAWNVGALTSCSLCGSSLETQNHLFFSCEYSAKVWKVMALGLLDHRFTSNWNHLIDIIADNRMDATTLFLTRYVFQAAVYFLWRERNARRHGDPHLPAAVMIRLLDKQVRNRCSTIANPKLQGSLQRWFSTRTT